MSIWQRIHNVIVLVCCRCTTITVVCCFQMHSRLYGVCHVSEVISKPHTWHTANHRTESHATDASFANAFTMLLHWSLADTSRLHLFVACKCMHDVTVVVMCRLQIHSSGRRGGCYSCAKRRWIQQQACNCNCAQRRVPQRRQCTVAIASTRSSSPPESSPTRHCDPNGPSSPTLGATWHVGTRGATAPASTAPRCCMWVYM